MGLLTADDFICLDCETTGLNVGIDRIIEIAVQHFTFSSVLAEFQTLVDPEMPIPAESTKIHNISDDMVQGKPKLAAILPQVLEMIKGKIIVGHGIGYDISMIQAEADRLGIPCQINKARSIDTVRLGRLFGEAPSNSLQTLAKHFFVEEETAHRAMGDVIVNIKVFKLLVQKFKRTEEIFDRLSRPIAMLRMPLGPHKGMLIKEVPEQYLRWAVTKNFDDDLIFTIRTELKRRGKSNSFSNSSNPFSSL